MLALAAGLLAAVPGVPPADWSTLGGETDRARTAVSTLGVFDLGSARWVASEDQMGRVIEPFVPGGVVADSSRAYFVALVDGLDSLVAVDLETGAVAWTAPVPFVLFDSWSTPTIDAENGAVLVTSDLYLTAYDASTGSQSWQTDLGADVVNASPLVTTDRGPSDRAILTTYDPFGASGELIAVNIDPFDALENPYQPGDVVWRIAIGATSGATPALRDGIVYVATADVPAGRVLAFDLDNPMTPLWSFTNVINESFFGGLSVAEGADGALSVFVASYAFFGGRDSANLIRLDAASGALMWTVACNRTASIPIPLGDGRLALSGGIEGFGSQPSLQIFSDHNTSASLVWDSIAETWTDDGDGIVEPGEFDALGGWTHQPLLVRSGEETRLMVGVPSFGAGFFGPSPMLRAIDVTSSPILEPDVFVGGGTTPGVGMGLLLTIGIDGLYALEAIDARFDVDGNLRLCIDDMYEWHEAPKDIDRDGDTDSDDVRALEARLRSGEIDDMKAGRRP